MAKIGVVLSGCGVYDGAEIHESVLTLLALDDAGAEYQCMAPNIEQMHVMDHLKGEPTDEKRNVLIESARIARGNIKDLAEVSAADYDGFIFPGGFGAAKNLCTFAVDGADCTVNEQVARLVKDAHSAGKPLAMVCIAPVIAAKVLGETGVNVTIGTEADHADAVAQVNSTGATHMNCPVDKAVVDTKNRIVSSPAYQSAGNLTELNASIRSAVKELLAMTSQTASAG